MFSPRERTDAADTQSGAGSLAVALGVAHATPPAIHLPSLSQRLVPGRSPLEATGWAAPDEPAPGRPAHR
ncbi:hypothetical protein [Cellulomonas palmilytica]|uniref:hypothetical protein n=1 Tax=Cellulomonas palmilytica TaxID=2608402 RepID=UPI001F34BFD5|nr:hypothetical protein [Cellulomonas palmilytica]UJP40366.1 hypothetical protein F1D97_02190 [Cellulomonas palmilytica]